MVGIDRRRDCYIFWRVSKLSSAAKRSIGRGKETLLISFISAVDPLNRSVDLSEHVSFRKHTTFTLAHKCFVGLGLSYPTRRKPFNRLAKSPLSGIYLAHVSADLPVYLCAEGAFGHPQVEIGLQPEPKFRRDTKIFA